MLRLFRPAVAAWARPLLPSLPTLVQRSFSVAAGTELGAWGARAALMLPDLSLDRCLWAAGHVAPWRLWGRVRACPL